MFNVLTNARTSISHLISIAFSCIFGACGGKLQATPNHLRNVPSFFFKYLMHSNQKRCSSVVFFLKCILLSEFHQWSLKILPFSFYINIHIQLILRFVWCWWKAIFVLLYKTAFFWLRSSESLLTWINWKTGVLFRLYCLSIIAYLVLFVMLSLYNQDFFQIYKCFLIYFIFALDLSHRKEFKVILFWYFFLKVEYQ